MTHKVNPLLFRLGYTINWKSRWLNKKTYRKNLKEDLAIKDYIFKKFSKIIVENVEIERFASRINLIIISPRPGLIIGRGGGGIEELKRGIEKKVFRINPLAKKKEKDLKIEIRELKDPETSATFLAAGIAEQIEKRISTKRAMKQALEKAKSHKEVKGIRIKVSGRIDGNEIARREKISWGSLPLQTLRANIDYGFVEAHCTYGMVGIKVWIYKQ